MNRSALITGVSSGIGLGLTKAYLQRGVRVYGLSRRHPPIPERNELVFKKADLNALETLPKAVEALLRGVEELDLVILNAAILGPIADLAETPVDEMQRVMQVNLWANKVLLDSVFKPGRPIGQVVAISSGAASNTNRGWNAYAISKAALNMLISLYAAERPQTHFCALAPGIVDTAMQEQVAGMPHDARFPSLEALRMARGSPMMPKPDDAAPRLIEGIAKATKFPSGSFLDINSIVKRSGRQ